jgi:type VI secretion system protein ImpG
VGHLVAERGGDPAAERLFQGAALLTARLRQRVDDDFPEIIQPLFDMLWPQYLRPTPACTMVVLRPLPNLLRTSQTIPRGTMLHSQRVTTRDGGSAQCPFQTTSSITLHPLELVDAALVRPRAGDLQVRLKIRVTGGGSLGQVGIGSLRLQLLGEQVVKYTLYQQLCGTAREVTVHPPGGDAVVRLPPSAIRPVGLGEEEAFGLPRPIPLPGLRLLREYFILADKFLGVEVNGLGGTPAAAALEDFELVFHLGAVDDLGVDLRPDNVSLGCVPAINLSESLRLDIRTSTRQHRYPLKPPHEGELFAVQAVSAYDPARAKWIRYGSFFDAGSQPLDRRARYFIVRHEAGVVEGARTFLEIVNVGGDPAPPETDLLQVDITYTTRTLSAQLGVGSVNQPSESSPEFASFTNVTPVVPGRSLDLGRERLWQLLAKLNLQPVDLCSRAGLELLIEEADPSFGAGAHDAVISVETSMGQRLDRRMVVPMRLVDIVLDASVFSCEGQCYLFARLLSKLFVRAPGSTTVSQVTVRCSSGAVYRFSPG